MRRSIRRSIVSASLVMVAATGACGAASAATLFNYVSASGVSDPQSGCPAHAPCANFFDALNETSAEGTIFVQGPYTLPSFTLPISISIVASGNVAATAMTIAVPAGKNILIEGLHFQRFDTSNGLSLSGAGKATVMDCVFTGFPGAAISLNGTSGARAVLENVTIKNSGVGLRVQGQNGATNVAFVQNSLIDGSPISAIVVDGAANTVVISDSTLSGSGALDLSLVNGGKAISYKSNVIRSGTPTQSLPEN